MNRKFLSLVGYGALVFAGSFIAVVAIIFLFTQGAPYILDYLENIFSSLVIGEWLTGLALLLIVGTVIIILVRKK